MPRTSPPPPPREAGHLPLLGQRCVGALGDPHPEGTQSSAVGVSPQGSHGSATTPQWAFQRLGGWSLESTENFPAERRGNTRFQRRVPRRPASKAAAIKGALSPHSQQPPLLVPRRGTGAHGTSSLQVPPTSRAPQLCPGHPASWQGRPGHPVDIPLMDGRPQGPAGLAAHRSCRNSLASGLREQSLPWFSQSS